MKFAKVVLIAALLAPSIAAAQEANPPVQPTNFVFLAPVVLSFLAAPLLLGDNNNALILPPTPTPSTTTSTR